jgi:hypothetical protein
VRHRMNVINVIIRDARTGLNIPCRVRKLAGRVANGSVYGTTYDPTDGMYSVGKKGKEKAYRCVHLARFGSVCADSVCFGSVQPKRTLSENFLGKLVFKLEHDVTFEDEVRFGPLKILEYLHDKVFKMVVLDTLLERLCMHEC